MRNLKRFLAMALTVLMVVGSFSAMSVSAAFDDVTDYQEAIDVMAALGILCGTEENTFEPDADIARWQMALIITKMMTGKVEAGYVEANFNTALNTTEFADLEEGQYMGAVAYADNNGIVFGTSATTFEPNESIMIQDVFAMVVRMLGYGSTAMNANYPWSFIDKAISLDLDAGLPANYSNEAAATRGETAQILYNALTAVKADGSTLGYDFFGLEKATVIITGTNKGNMFNNKATIVSKTADGVDYVAFNVLNADGSIGSQTYYAPKSEFGIEGNANAYVGYPFVVRTVDSFASFMTCDAIEAVVADQDAVVGAASNGNKKVVTIDGTAYTLVKTYSDYINDNNSEIILNMVGSLSNTIDYGSFVMDGDLNILDKNGDVLLYWVTTQGFGNDINYANLNGTYLYKVAEGKYIVPNDYIWAQAATYVADLGSVTGFQVITDSYAEIEQYDAYSDTVLFDIDGDGDYDRGIYTQYSFAKAAVSSDKLNVANNDKAADVAIYDTDGNALALADISGKYILYAYNPLYKTLIVKAIFATNTALVTGADLANMTITFNGFGVDFLNGAVAGEKYALGNGKLKGAVVASEGTYFSKVLGKNVVYVEDNGVVLAVEHYADNAEYMVVTGIAGFTTMGYPQIVGYHNGNNALAATKSVITINALNNYWYSQFNTSIIDVLKDDIAGTKKGDYSNLVSLTKDALGNYDAQLVAANYKTVSSDSSDAVISIKNGIASATGIADFPTFKVDSDFVWIVNNGNDLGLKTIEYQTFVGAPANGAEIDVNEGAYIYYDAEAKFIYIDDGSCNVTASGGSYNPWGTAPVASTIVYIDNAAYTSVTASNVYGNTNIFGMTYSYKNAIDMINGGFVDVTYTDYSFNKRLEAGHFYKVEGGIVVGEADDLVDTAILLAAKKADGEYFYTTVEDDATDTKDAYTDDKVLTTLYTLSNGTIVKNGDGTIADSIANKDAVYTALNDDTTDGKDDGIVVYYAKAMNYDSTPLFLAKVTDAKTVDVYVKPVEKFNGVKKISIILRNETVSVADTGNVTEFENGTVVTTDYTAGDTYNYTKQFTDGKAQFIIAIQKDWTVKAAYQNNGFEKVDVPFELTKLNEVDLLGTNEYYLLTVDSAWDVDDETAEDFDPADIIIKLECVQK